ncbi:MULTISPECIES: signal peptide peptidase SppA [unclassified Sphingomonas]|uniref:signal peptide peptidase SppA n=1 Tax=Novosphingobium rhizosphaerae TaxID=1551649 RepID=UPI0015C9AE74
MKFARSVWKVLVAIKDGLVLLFLLLFFWVLYAALTIRPVPGQVHDGALTITLNGSVVEERSSLQPAQILLSGEAPEKEFQARDVARAIEAAADDTRIKAVVLDLEAFTGGRQVHISRIGAAMDKVRAAHKPVLVRALLYTDDAVQLAAHSSEAWVDPIGGAVVTGPGGSQLYYKALMDKLKIKAHIFKVGTYKSAVEPYARSDASPEAKENLTAIYGALWNAWKADVKKARPRADIDLVTRNPAQWLAQSGGDMAQAAVKAGLVDKVGDKVAFGKRVGDLVGHDLSAGDGGYKGTTLAQYLADKPAPKTGKAIAVVTVAGTIVDGEAGPGTAGGTRIADLIDQAVTSGNYAALVVRVDSPGGSVTAAERIRAAIARARAKGLPVAVSMANLAASGGYWVSTPAQRVFAEPATITGSIGVFAVIPSFEDTLANYGVTADGVRTTPLSGQPDIVGGLSPEFEALSQASVESYYARFLRLVADARHKSPQDIDKIAQGRVWDGGTARQLGLVDQFGELEDAVAWAAKAAKADSWHAEFLGANPGSWQGLLADLMNDDSSTESRAAGDVTGMLALRQQALGWRVLSDLARLNSAVGAQVYCLECGSLGPVAARPAQGLVAQASWLGVVGKLF